MSDSEGDAVRAMKEEHPEWFEQIREGLVVHPGDHLILTFPAQYGQDKDMIRDKIAEGFPDDLHFSLIFGAEQVVVVRRGAS